MVVNERVETAEVCLQREIESLRMTENNEVDHFVLEMVADHEVV